jgi:hypothetical protein
MIAAFLQFNHSPTIIASLPARLLGRFEKCICLFVLRTVLCAMPFTITYAAYLGLTTATFTILTTTLAMYVPRFDPFSTSSSWTIEAILRCILLKFLVPELLEVDIK